MSIRAASRSVRLSKSEVQRWVGRASDCVLDEVDWSDRSRAPHRTRRTASGVESKIVAVREFLRKRSALGEYGARAVHAALAEKALVEAPSVRTIGRIFERSGLLDGQRRVRRPPPPAGWYLPSVASGQAELDSFDVVTGLVLRGGLHIDVLNGVSLRGGLVGSWPTRGATASFVAKALYEHWSDVGLPWYAQFDNDTRFQGAHQHPGVVGTVSRLCLALRVTPVFAPPRETGFQAAIESYNGRWQAKVWSRFLHANLRALQLRSQAYVTAHRERASQRSEGVTRRPFHDTAIDFEAHPSGKLIYLRRTDAKGQAQLLGSSFRVDRHWVHRLVRAEVDLDKERIRFFALRRRDPQDQPQLAEVEYRLPRRPRPFNQRHWVSQMY